MGEKAFILFHTDVDSRGMPKFKDLSGKKFGRWTVIRFSKRVGKYYLWVCQCKCGKTGYVNRDNLKYGTSKSCGCLKKEETIKRNTTHGKTNTKTFKSWCAIKQRTLNKNNNMYYAYGGRGIKLCKRWRSFENFLADMGERPKGTSIDRINNNGGYNPSNCRWTTNKQQAKNKSNTILVTYKKRTKPLIEWANELGINYKTLVYRIKIMGLSPKIAFRISIIPR